jgi:hypothetical protein
MSVICGVNSEPETNNNPIFVCHHCGMPICQQHGWILTADDAFAGSSTPVSRAAIHCQKCADDFHRGAPRHHGWADPKLTPAVTAQAAGQEWDRAAGRS